MLSLLRRGPKAQYSKKDHRTALNFARTFPENPSGALAELEALGLDQAWAEAVLDHFHPDAPQPELEDVEPETAGVETAIPGTVTAEPSGVERLAIEIPAGYVDTVEQRAKLIAALHRRLGEGWQVESVDLQNLAAVIVRGELPALRPGAATFGLADKATASNGEASAAAYSAAGRTMLGYNPFTRRAETATLPPATLELRARLLRKLPKQRSWELELLPIFGVRDGVGHLAQVIITRADTVSPERGKEIAHWLGLARTVIGHNGWWVKIDDTTGVITMNASIPLKVPDRAPYDYDVIEAGKWGELVVGRDGYNKPVIVDLAATPHALVVGRTGSGKSIFIQSMIFSALAHSFDVAVIDPVKEGLDYRFAQPYTRAGGWGCQSFPEALAAIEEVYEESQRRKAVLSQLGVPNWTKLSKDDQLKYGFKPILVVIDEGTSLAKLTSIPKSLDKDDHRAVKIADRNSAKELIVMHAGNILRECRFVAIHLLFGTQRFGTKEIGGDAGEMRENMGTRIVLGRTSTTSLAMACADPQDAAEAYELAHGQAAPDEDPASTEREATPGRGLAEIDGRGHVALQGAYAPVDELIARLEALGVPRYEGDRRPVVPEKESPFSFEEIVPEQPKAIKDLGEIELSIDDLEEADPADEPTEAPELDWSTAHAATESEPSPAEDPFAGVAKTKPRPVFDDDDPFSAPAKPRGPKVEFDWDS